ncbi:hypothetical protein GCM10018787_49510 [Streptomyces thermodiastaticus]|nr:hypothetical protein GCM10018787_49510 [Streptomyces thermodiastaticus]
MVKKPSFRSGLELGGTVSSQVGGTAVQWPRTHVNPVTAGAPGPDRIQRPDDDRSQRNTRPLSGNAEPAAPHFRPVSFFSVASPV